MTREQRRHEARLAAWALAWGVAGGVVIGWAACVALRVRPLLEACK